MASTKRFMNWTAVTFTAASGNTTTTITGVTNLTIAAGGSLAKFAGDGDRYNTTIVNDMNDPAVTVQSADFAALEANPVGTVGTFTATLNDSRGLAATGSGARTYTLATAVVADFSRAAAHAQFGQGTLTLTAYSTDGVTNPLAVAVA